MPKFLIINESTLEILDCSNDQNHALRLVNEIKSKYTETKISLFARMVLQ